jgi:hypothetical protein
VGVFFGGVALGFKHGCAVELRSDITDSSGELSTEIDEFVSKLVSLDGFHSEFAV